MASNLIREIAKTVLIDKDIQSELEPSFEEATEVITMEDALLHIGNRFVPARLRAIVSRGPS